MVMNNVAIGAMGVRVVVNKNDVIVDVVDVDPNINDQDDNHDNDDSMLMVVVDLEDVFGDTQGEVLEVELERLSQLSCEGRRKKRESDYGR